MPMIMCPELPHLKTLKSKSLTRRCPGPALPGLHGTDSHPAFMAASSVNTPPYPAPGVCAWDPEECGPALLHGRVPPGTTTTPPVEMGARAPGLCSVDTRGRAWWSLVTRPLTHPFSTLVPTWFLETISQVMAGKRAGMSGRQGRRQLGLECGPPSGFAGSVLWIPGQADPVPRLHTPPSTWTLLSAAGPASAHGSPDGGLPAASPGHAPPSTGTGTGTGQPDAAAFDRRGHAHCLAGQHLCSFPSAQQVPDPLHRHRAQQHEDSTSSRCCRLRSRPNAPCSLLLASQPTPTDNGAEVVPSPRHVPVWVKPADLDRDPPSFPPTHSPLPVYLRAAGK